MRSLIIAVSVLVVALLAGCSSQPAPAPAPAPTRLVWVQLDPNAGQQERRVIQAKLAAIPGVRTVTYLTAEATYEDAKKEFANDPDLLKILRPQAFSDNFKLVVDDRATADRVSAAVDGMPGVSKVDSPAPPTLSPTPPTPPTR